MDCAIVSVVADWMILCRVILLVKIASQHTGYDAKNVIKLFIAPRRRMLMNAYTVHRKGVRDEVSEMR